MPLYEYACPHCQTQFELLLRGGEQPACPTCGTSRVEKQLSVPAAHTAGAALPMSAPPPMAGGCGKPQCGGGFCAGM